MGYQLHYEDVEQGMELPVLEKHPTTRQLVMYAGASGDLYEVHYDQEIAHALGLPGVILQGALKNGFLAQFVTDWIGDGGTLKKLGVRYRAMDAPGSTLYCKGAVTRKYVEDGQHLVGCDIWTDNGDGEKTTRGSALVALPSREP